MKLCEQCNDVRPDCRHCQRCRVWICRDCIDAHFGRCSCGTTEDEMEKYTTTPRTSAWGDRSKIAERPEQK